MLGFQVSMQDNDSYAFREYPPLTEYQRIHQALLPDMSGNSRPNVLRCNACAELLGKWDESLSGLIVKKRKYDISVTFDGVTLVSKRFQSAYESAALSGLAFKQLPDDADFLAVRPSRSVEFDAERRKTRFINRCATCCRFESVVGATPVYLKAGTIIGLKEFVRTDLEFGSNDEKHPLLLCGRTAAEVIKNAKFKGIHLNEQVDSE